MDLLAILFAKYVIYLLVLYSLIILFLEKRTIQKKMIIFAGIILPITFVASRIISSFFYSTRPFVVGHFTPLISHVADNGFPSDHALLSFSLACVIFIFNKKFGIYAFIMGILIGVARIYAGIHSPIDIAGGFVLCALVAYLVYQITKIWI